MCICIPIDFLYLFHDILYVAYCVYNFGVCSHVVKSRVQVYLGVWRSWIRGSGETDNTKLFEVMPACNRLAPNAIVQIVSVQMPRVKSKAAFFIYNFLCGLVPCASKSPRYLSNFSHICASRNGQKHRPRRVTKTERCPNIRLYKIYSEMDPKRRQGGSFAL